LGGFALIDPCVFVDDDGQAYIYVGGGARCQGAKLNSDMMSLQTPPEDMLGLHDFHEAAWVFKRNGLYYLSYSDNTQPENYMCYAVSETPLGPWTHKCAYLSPVGCETTHGSVMAFKGQWYQFYHCQDISNMGNLRSICVDKLFFDEEGNILPVEQTRGRVNETLPADAVWYGPEKLSPFNGARSETAGDGCVAGLEQEGAGLCVTEIDGRDGGPATLWFKYETAERWAKLRLTVNGRDESFINCLGPEGFAKLTVPLKPGQENELALSHGNGDVRVKGMGVTYLPH
jgi:hypothetical protein